MRGFHKGTNGFISYISGVSKMSVRIFYGFPEACLDFFEQLRNNNRKQWFDEHREDFEKNVMTPARLFVHDMGNALREIAPGIIADSRMNRSIFRPYRDTRFSHNKTPYKTHLGIFFWEGRMAKMDCPGFYFHLEPPTIMLGVGNHCFSRDHLEQYRQSVVDPVHGKSLNNAIRKVVSKGPYEIGVEKYKKVPRGCDKNHENARLLLLAGLTASCEMPAPDELMSNQLIDFCFERFRDMQPIHKWLVEMNERIMKSTK